MTSRPAVQAGAEPAPLRVLVVDDSPEMRRVILDALGSDPRVEVVGQAADGEEALRLCVELEPECVCVDLEMPRMDGFTFLRLLMAKRPVPVLVISSSVRKPEVFKALELGALDCIAKPERDGAPDAPALREELLAKLATIRGLVPLAPEQGAPAVDQHPAPAVLHAAEMDDEPAPGPDRPAVPLIAAAPPPAIRRRPAPGPPGWLVVIGASTGGPAALTRLLSALPRELPVAYAVAQHMPRPFTAGFAERLGRSSGLDVREAQEGDEFVAGRVLIAPGGRHLGVVRTGGASPVLRATLRTPDPAEGRRYCPSVDLLFESAAAAMGDRVCAVVLTGMGNDGRQGIARVKQAGGVALAESEESAVAYGMPRQAAGTGLLDAVAPLEELVLRIARVTEAG